MIKKFIVVHLLLVLLQLLLLLLLRLRIQLRLLRNPFLRLRDPLLLIGILLLPYPLRRTNERRLSWCT